MVNLVLDFNFSSLFIRKIIFYFALFVLGNCKGYSFNSDEGLFAEIFLEGGRKNPKIVFQKEVNLDDSEEIEIVIIVRNGNEEILTVFDNSKKKILFKKFFTLLNFGPIDYNLKEKKWEVNNFEAKNDLLYIIKSISFEKIGNDSYNSIFLEILSEEPPLELFSIPLVFRNYILIFDGLETFKESKILKDLNRIPFSFVSEKKSIHVFSENPKFDKFYSLAQ